MSDSGETRRSAAAEVLLRAQSQLVYSEKKHKDTSADSDSDESAIIDDEKALREVFTKFDSRGKDSLSLEDFVKIVKDVLKLNLSETEIGRIWRYVDESNSGFINFAQFVKAVKRRKFMKLVVSNYVASSKIVFEIPKDYDYGKPTCNNYRLPDEDEKYAGSSERLFGKFKDIRLTLDRKYHGDYTEKRQKWQDEVISNVVIRTEPQPRPWIVYTCGPMGVGKGYALSWMSLQGFFPLENIVHIDPDHFKAVMPEWNEYVKIDDEKAGTMCHRESGYLQEIAQEVALRNSQNIWVDGSLRDGPWFAKVFDDIRLKYPSYRIAIFYIFASEKVIRDRIKKRFELTGRSIPEDLIKASLESPDRSLGILTPKCDFVARINNENRVPYLAAFEFVDHSGCWNVLQKNFAKTMVSPQEFPESLSPLFIDKTDFSDEYFLIPKEQKKLLSDFSNQSLIKLEINREALIASDNLSLSKIGKHNVPEKSFLYISPTYPINLDLESRSIAKIPAEAYSFAFCYPLHNVQHDCCEEPRLSVKDLNLCFFLIGGFIYFDLEDKLLSANCIGTGKTNNLVQFGPSHKLNPVVITELKDRWQPVTLPHLALKGAKYFAWIVPGERIGGVRLCKYGGFAYLFHSLESYSEEETERNCLFPVISN